jgi:carboxymethylenebutenolidase
MAKDRLPEDQNWVRMEGLSRRDALTGGAFALGFAAACRPVAATTIKTAATGLEEQSVTIALSGEPTFRLPLYIARPKGATQAPIIIVVHEIFGVHEWIRDICRRFAKAGYMAVAPDLYARQGDATRISDIKTLVDTIVSKTSDATVMADIDAAVSWAGQHGGDATKLGITGFCWGGRIVWLYAAHSPRLDAGAAFYGRLAGKPTPLQPSMPVDVVDQLRAPVLGLYGGLDKGIPVTDVQTMQAKLKAAGKVAKINLYPKADHGFMADYRPSYQPVAAKAAWTVTLAWFDRYVKRG